jgi:D-threo-aldose 1-dehydrogenase
MARMSRKESVRLLDVAFDAGITHFDVARLYGYGAAEIALGDFLERHCDEVTVTTKFGIDPPGSRAFAMAHVVARRVAALAPPVRARLRRRAEARVAHGRFGAADARRSIEQSLAALRTDHVDVLMLHEPQPGDVGDELVALMDECRRRGLTRAVGLACDRAAAAALVRERPEVADAVQVPDSVLDGEAPDYPGRLLVTHSAIAAPRERLGAEPRLLLAAALARNPGGTVLVSSRTDAHIRANARLVDAPPAPEELEALARRLSAGGGAPSASRGA